MTRQLRFERVGSERTARGEQRAPLQRRHHRGEVPARDDGRGVRRPQGRPGLPLQDRAAPRLAGRQHDGPQRQRARGLRPDRHDLRSRLRDQQVRVLRPLRGRRPAATRASCATPTRTACSATARRSWPSRRGAGNNSWHSVGSMGFDKDKNLWMLHGEFVTGAPAQDLGSNLGKLLPGPAQPPGGHGRVHARDGQPGGAAVYARGLRSPWRGAYHPGKGWYFMAEVGPDRSGWEEVNVVTAAGANLGWPGGTCNAGSVACWTTGLRTMKVQDADNVRRSACRARRALCLGGSALRRLRQRSVRGQPDRRRSGGRLLQRLGPGPDLRRQPAPRPRTSTWRRLPCSRRSPRARTAIST